MGENGNSVSDAELLELEDHLCDLVGFWLACSDDMDRRNELVREYHATYCKLRSLGWRGGIDFQCLLPYELMPEEFQEKVPKSSLADIVLRRWRKAE